MEDPRQRTRFKLRGKRVAGAKRQATGDKKIGGSRRGEEGEKEKETRMSVHATRK